MDRNTLPRVKKADKATADLNPGHPRLKQLFDKVREKYTFLQPSVVPDDEALVGWALRGSNAYGLELVVYMTLGLVNRTEYFNTSDAKSLNEYLSRLTRAEQERIVSNIGWSFQSGITKFAEMNTTEVPVELYPIVDARMDAIAVTDDKMEADSEEEDGDPMEMDEDSVIQQRTVILAQRRSLQQLHTNAYAMMRTMKSDMVVEKQDNDTEDIFSFPAF